MKKTLAIAIVLASITTFAQSEATTAPTAPATTEQAAPAAKSPAKKAKKKKAKKTSSNEVQTTQAVAATTTANTQTVASADAQAQTANMAQAPATAAGTTTAVTAEVAPTKKWSASFVSQANMTNNSIVHTFNEDKVEIINYLGAGYSVTKDTKVGFRQYFNYDLVPEKASKAVSSWTVATVGTKFNGVAGSDAIAPLFWYYLPTQDALKNVYNTNDTLNHGGILRMDAEIAWTLNPKWTVSYYLNPRQSLANKQDYTDRDGKTKSIESTTTLIHYGYLYYNVNDAIQPYAYIGMDSRMTTRNMTSIKDHAITAIGSSFTMFGGKFILNPEIANEVALKDNGEYVSAPRWFQSEDMAYQLTAVIAL